MKLLNELRRSESVFVKDEDSHSYLIPQGEEDNFNEWCEAMAAYRSRDDLDEASNSADWYTGAGFEDYRIGMDPNSWEFPPEAETGWLVEKLIDGYPHWLKIGYSDQNIISALKNVYDSGEFNEAAYVAYELFLSNAKNFGLHQRVISVCWVADASDATRFARSIDAAQTCTACGDESAFASEHQWG